MDFIISYKQSAAFNGSFHSMGEGYPPYSGSLVMKEMSCNEITLRSSVFVLDDECSEEKLEGWHWWVIYFSKSLKTDVQWLELLNVTADFLLMNISNDPTLL